jgi:hypothetical protein
MAFMKELQLDTSEVAHFIASSCDWPLRDKSMPRRRGLLLDRVQTGLPQLLEDLRTLLPSLEVGFVTVRDRFTPEATVWVHPQDLRNVQKGVIRHSTVRRDGREV